MKRLQLDVEECKRIKERIKRQLDLIHYEKWIQLGRQYPHLNRADAKYIYDKKISYRQATEDYNPYFRSCKSIDDFYTLKVWAMKVINFDNDMKSYGLECIDEINYVFKYTLKQKARYQMETFIEKCLPTDILMLIWKYIQPAEVNPGFRYNEDERDIEIEDDFESDSETESDTN